MTKIKAQTQLHQHHAATESSALALRQNNWQQAFIELYSAYAPELYRLSYVALYHHQRQAERTVEAVFHKALKHFHSFQTSGSHSFRTYLYTLAVPLLMRQRADLHFEGADTWSWSRRMYTQSERSLWHAIQQLSPQEFIIHELWQGAHLVDHDIAIAAGLDIYQVRAQADHITRVIREVVPDYDSTWPPFRDKRALHTQLSKQQHKRILKRVLKGKRPSVTFVTHQWWANILGPIPFGFAAGIVLVAAAGVWYAQAPRPIVNEQPVTVPDAIIEPRVQQRPSVTIAQGGLPGIIENKRLLTQIDGNLYGTDYPTDRSAEETAAANGETELKPEITMNVPVREFREIENSFVYNVPQNLPEDKLQQLAFEHFSSLPLNQFTYTNNTFYIQESPTEFRPLFIAFNGNGSVEYQMRQSAICNVPSLTNRTDENYARGVLEKFLEAHNLNTVEFDQIQIQLISESGKTVPKNTFCKNDDTTPVNNFKFVVYLPHKVLRFAEGGDDVLPIRQRGIVVEMHGDTVTSMKIDPFYNMYDAVVRSEVVNLIPLETAVEQVKNFVYPAQANQADAKRFQLVYPQWDHQFGNKRLQNITLDTVRLEFVYDNLNKSVEPYYVFSGIGTDATGNDDSVRMYVVASEKEIELRSPYRE